MKSAHPARVAKRGLSKTAAEKKGCFGPPTVRGCLGRAELDLHTLIWTRGGERGVDRRLAHRTGAAGRKRKPWPLTGLGVGLAGRLVGRPTLDVSWSCPTEPQGSAASSGTGFPIGGREKRLAPHHQEGFVKNHFAILSISEKELRSIPRADRAPDAASIAVWGLSRASEPISRFGDSPPATAMANDWES